MLKFILIPNFAIDFGIQRKIALFYRLKNCLRTLQVCSHFFSAIKFSSFASRFSNSIAKSGLIFFLCTISQVLAAKELPEAIEWTKQWGTEKNEYCNGVAADSAGNVYVIGCGSGTFKDNINSGNIDVFITKYDRSGDQKWARQFGTAGFDEACGVAVDSLDNIYIAGTADGEFAGNKKTGKSDVFITKYDKNGALQWTKQFGTPNDDYAKGIAVDYSGNIYIAGYTLGAFDGRKNSGDFNIFLTKYDKNGSRQWIKQKGTVNDDVANGIAADNLGNIYVVGSTAGAFKGSTNSGGNDAFLIKFDTNGEQQWISQWGTAGFDEACGAAVDRSGSIYVIGNSAGAFANSKNFGEYDIFLTKYDKNGSRQWTRQFGTQNNDKANGIALDSLGNIYISGYTQGAFAGCVNSGEYDAFLTMYDKDGRQQWARQWGTGKNDYVNGIVIDRFENIYAAGDTGDYFKGNFNAGYRDIFLSKINLSFDKKKNSKEISGNSKVNERAKEQPIVQQDIKAGSNLVISENKYQIQSSSGEVKEPKYDNDSIIINTLSFNTAAIEKFEIELQLKENSHVKVIILSSNGQIVKQLINEKVSAGRSIIKWNGKNKFGEKTAAGAYYIVTITDREKDVKKIVISD